ncbi:putative NUDIX hydrolase [Phaeobacter inhibens]|uniref:NUDIX hydrolase n=1 Tax=Phaeobacter inhibens TaxID=221822 RepID=UPI000C99ACCF|nr:NUDIX hydrolase [Phaeobacter inhibens]AUQ59206.1 putative NUDIX hydrolase [Phaeobacter inhibens]AUQ63283.1 putative NUDIX hydrolase [Phaeobacter inhibens]AUQ83189.1 putative NUDIX hydrolase [Phaeobacter inhibens]AUQ90948.1 putative NUDIX hydrolase [Phaeobacter inhibens]AUR12320.1 putative NUDIX hydrolase [Phaeobacter inhibens]
MKHIMSSAWEEYLRPMFFRPKRLQVAVMCYRNGDKSKEVLMITSRGTGRWIVPKGWPIKGMNGPQSALQEAWEEAGVRDARIEGEPVGTYEYMKLQDNGTKEVVHTLVYVAEVSELSDDYPEQSERTREWMSPKAAAELVAEPELSDLLRQL